MHHDLNIMASQYSYVEYLGPVIIWQSKKNGFLPLRWYKRPKISVLKIEIDFFVFFLIWLH